MDKRCKKCGELKSYDSFYKSSTNKDGVENYCKECSKKRFKEYHTTNIDKRKEYQKEYRKNNKDKIKNTNILWRYSISSQEADEMFMQQGCKCAICSKVIIKTKDRHIDHCHSSGQVRGILCAKCNTAIGLLNEDTNIMISAISYVAKHNDNTTGFTMQEMRAEYTAGIEALKNELAVLKGAK